MVPTAEPGLVRWVATVGAAETPSSACALGDQLGQPEVQYLGLAARAHEDVGGLDVAMDDPLGVRGVERVGDLDAEIEDLLQLERLALDAVLERLAFQELHGDEALALVFADFIDGADVGMVERRGGARLALEARQRLLVAGDIFGQELERHHAAELGVLGLVDHAHAPAAQLAQNAIVGKRATDQ